MTTQMTTARFAQICEAYGANPRLWPAAERDAAQAFAVAAPEAHALLARASTLDEGLAALPALAPSAGLRARILAVRPQPARRWLAVIREDLFGWRPALPALALALVAGVALGLWMSVDSVTDDPLNVVQVAAFQNDLEDY